MRMRIILCLSEFESMINHMISTWHVCTARARGTQPEQYLIPVHVSMAISPSHVATWWHWCYQPRTQALLQTAI